MGGFAIDTFYWLIENLATFSELYIGTIFCASFIPEVSIKENHVRRIVISIIFMFCMSIINHISLFSPVSLALGLVVTICTQISVYKSYPIRLSLLGILYVLIIFLIDNVVVNFISYMINIPISSIYEKHSIYRVMAIISSKIILFIFITFIYHFFRKTQGINLKYLLLMSFLTIAMFFMTALLMFQDIKNNVVSSIISIIFFILMLLMQIMMYFGTFGLMEHYTTKQQIEMIDMKNQMLEQSLNETEQTFQLWKKSLHDYKHQVAALKAMAENGNLEELKSVLDKESMLLSQQLFYYKTGNETVDILLSMKQHISESKKIPFMIHASVPENCPITPSHFATILGNLLDNAIEASEQEDNPYIEVKIGQVKQQFVIAISNRCTNPVSEKTTKKDKIFHGIGLYSVRQTIQIYDGEFITEQNDDIFHAKIMIPI